MNWRTVAADAAIIPLGIGTGWEFRTGDAWGSALLGAALLLVLIGRLYESYSIAKARHREIEDLFGPGGVYL